MGVSRYRPSPAFGRLGMLATVGAGIAIEVYDLGIYATFSVFFASQFFASGDAGSDLISTLAVFAVGFVARPFGGLFFGWMADQVGRQPAMTLSVVTAAAGSLIIGVSPTATTIGIGAPIVLLLARLIQGFAQGGELPAAQTYLAEISPASRRGRWSSLNYVSGSLGGLFATALGAVLATLLSRSDMTAFGWRIPFLLGGVLGLFGAVMRRRLDETPIFTSAAAPGRRTSPWRQMGARPVLLLQVIGLTAGVTVAFYTWSAAVLPFAIEQRHTNPAAALWVTAAATVLFTVSLPLWGAAADRVGRRPILLVSMISTAVLLFPLQGLIQGQAWQLFVAAAVATVLLGGTLSILPALFAELFPTGIRALGLAVPYSLTVAAFGGTAPYLQAYLGQHDAGAAFYWWVIALIAITVVTVALSPETRSRELDAVGSAPARSAARARDHP
ncbi:MFS transporter [Pseudonocardia alaniniphila]|uniref:MFS transporter n=1 Tax=Pseudonocardia alaniniphila TaxID=75291 RepID=A0ABS9T6L8_9PSEU|nr:MFS transporter [Pseudonocardia alaniniphila]MCH6164083.1 MFS transporter [Pseudonocardia alaniniphila]